MRAAAAVFVKSPGLSPLKTRLAASIGQAEAETFYRLSCLAVAEVLERTPALQRRYWAVAEKAADGLEIWQSFPCLWQGEGDLGQRLHAVYSELIARDGLAILLGADAPQLTPALLTLAVERARQGEFVIGPAADGGFYLFAGSRPLPAEVWTQIHYSQSSTRLELLAQLGPERPCAELSSLRDIDEIADLLCLMDDWKAAEPDLLTQKELQRWCREQLASHVSVG